MNHIIGFILILLLGLLVFHKPIWQLAGLSFQNELYSHFLLIPIVSIFLGFQDRQKIFKNIRWNLRSGLIPIAGGLVCYLIAVAQSDSLSLNDFMACSLLGYFFWIHGGFIASFGSEAYRKALFSLLFLVFCIPIPDFVLEPVIRFLQVWSAHAVHLAFQIIGVPHLREDMIFQLPGIVIEIAKECSGIRSSLALLITIVLAGHMFLRTKWRKIILAMTIIPFTIIKNAIRITTLSVLAVNLDKAWLTDSWLHKGGGIVFFIVVLLLLAPVLWLLIRFEPRSPVSWGWLPKKR